MKTCAMGTPLNGRNKCPKCGAGPQDTCGEWVTWADEEIKRLQADLERERARTQAWRWEEERDRADKAEAEIERLRDLFRKDGEGHANTIKDLTKRHEARIAKYADRIAALDRLRSYAASVWFDEATATDEERELMREVSP